jgi:DNA-binding NarL/FixJ family response regulator
MSTTETPPIRVLLADDHASVRQGLCALFVNSAEVDLVTDVSDGADAIAMAKSLAPDVVVIDLSMPTSGLVALKQIKEDCPATRVVVLSRHRDPAYVRKQSPFDELKRAVLAAARGDSYIDDQLASDQSVKRNGAAGASPLSPREVDVLRRAAAGCANKEIASELKISVKTVEAHKSNAMRKLRLKDRSAVVRFALLQGWLET